MSASEYPPLRLADAVNLPKPSPEIARAILLRYHEIALKGGNRRRFEERLAINARRLVTRALGDSGEKVVAERGTGRILLRAEWNDASREALTHVFGIEGFGPVRIIPTSRQNVIDAALAEFEICLEKYGRPASFRVETRRSDKVIAETSLEFDRVLGDAILTRHPGIAVNLKKPALTVGVEIRRNHSYIWVEKIPGPGGLPVGSNSPLLTLISGGLDSPVAAIRVLKRGSATSFIHFHGTPFVGDESLTKVEDLVRVVNRYQPTPMPLNIVPFGKIQEKIALATHAKLRTVLYRRLMVRVACRVAERHGLAALVTGEALGQVASQTVENLSTINRVSSLPILRPLVAFDKQEIIDEAKARQTYAISIRPADDCCTLFADRHPALAATEEAVAAEEAKLDLEALIQESLAGITVFRQR